MSKNKSQNYIVLDENDERFETIEQFTDALITTIFKEENDRTVEKSLNVNIPPRLEERSFKEFKKGNKCIIPQEDLVESKKTLAKVKLDVDYINILKPSLKQALDMHHTFNQLYFKLPKLFATGIEEALVYQTFYKCIASYPDLINRKDFEKVYDFFSKYSLYFDFQFLEDINGFKIDAYSFSEKTGFMLLKNWGVSENEQGYRYSCGYRDAEKYGRYIDFKTNANTENVRLIGKPVESVKNSYGVGYNQPHLQKKEIDRAALLFRLENEIPLTIFLDVLATVIFEKYKEVNEKLQEKKVIKKKRKLKDKPVEHNLNNQKTITSKKDQKEYTLDELSIKIVYDRSTVINSGIKRDWERRTEGWEVNGHWRNYKTGKKVWIPAYGKGDLSKKKGKTIKL